MADKLSNFAYSAVATAPSPATTGTSLVVTAGHGTRFPTVPFNVVVWPANQLPLSTNAEIVRVTNVSTDTFTIDREEEGTTARSIQVGDQIAQNITERMMDDRLPIVNVQNYGAIGDDSTDNYQAITNAIAASSEGDIIYFPLGIYRVSAPIILKRNRTYQGSHSPHWYYRGGVVCAIKPHSTFTGDEIVHIPDKEITASSDDNDGGRIFNLAVDGNSFGASKIGIHFEGLVRDWLLRDVDVSQTSGNGVACIGYVRADAATYYPRGLIFDNVSTYSAGNNGFVLNSSTDSTFQNCLSVSAAAIGYLIDSPGETKLIGCRSVFNVSDGFRVTGSVSVGGIQIIGCSTDRNGKYGVKVTATGTQPCEITGMLTRRDGSSATGNLAGVGLIGSAGNYVVPVVITGLTQTVGVDDGGGGNITPQYGIYAEYTKSIMASGNAWGVDSAIGNGGNNLQYDFIHLIQRANAWGDESGNRLRGTNEVDNLRVVKNAYFDEEVDNGNSGAGATINWANGNKQKITVSTNTTFTFVDPIGPCNVVLKLVNGGAFTVNWAGEYSGSPSQSPSSSVSPSISRSLSPSASQSPSLSHSASASQSPSSSVSRSNSRSASPSPSAGVVYWPGGIEPTFTASGTDIVSFYYDGLNYYGVASLAFA